MAQTQDKQDNNQHDTGYKLTTVNQHGKALVKSES